MAKSRYKSRTAVRGAAAVASCAAVAIAVAACGGSKSSTASNSSNQGTAHGGTQHIAFVLTGTALPFYQTMRCGAEEAAKKYNVSLNWQGEAEWNEEKEMTVLEDALQAKPEGVVLMPGDPKSFIAPVHRLMSEHVPVATIDGTLEQHVELQNVRTSPESIGSQGADALAKAIGEKGKVLIVGLNPAITGNQVRVNAFVKRIKEKYPEIELLPIQYPGVDVAKAAEDVSAAIVANPGLKGIFASHAAAGEGAESAVAAASKTGSIQIVAEDTNPKQVADLKAGKYAALIAQNPKLEGFEAVKLVSQVLSKEVSESSVAPEHLTKAVTITRQNVDEPAMQRYLYKSGC